MATQTELVNAAIRHGLTPERARIAAAVGMAESGGDTNAHNTNAATGDNSYGAWQINMLGAMGPARRVQFGIASNDELFDLDTNARAMSILSQNGQNFSDWTTYTTTDPEKSYERFLDGHLIQVGGDNPDGGQSTIGKIGDALNPLDELSAFVDMGNKTARWVSNSENWVRVGYVVGGSALMIVGLVMMIQSTSLGSAVTKVIPAGRAVNLARKVAS